MSETAEKVDISLNSLFELLIFMYVTTLSDLRSWRVLWKGEVCTGCWWGNLRKRGHWGDPDVDGMIILKWIFRKLEGWWGLMELAQDRDRWRALVSTVKSFLAP
jgi:hypothetical protein